MFSSLFLGVCDERVDGQLLGTNRQWQMLLRFDKLESQLMTENPNIIVVVHNGERSGCLNLFVTLI